MPSISRIRFTNVVYDGGKKRYIDTTFRFDGYNGILLLENGAGKTVFVQTLIQAVLPRKTVAQRKIQETLLLSNSIAHIAVEWILENDPRRYALTAVSLFLNSKDQLASQEFAYEYGPDDRYSIERLPFVRQDDGKTRPATKEELATLFRSIADNHMTAKFFSENDTIQSYGAYIEKQFRIIPAEWNKIAAINETEGGVEAFFENCRTNETLVDRLLIPTVEEGIADENGTAGEGGNGFAELFEKQRDHFRQQRVLQKRIEEMRGVVDRMEAYTAVQKTTYDLETELGAVNGKLKTLYQKMTDVLAARRLTARELAQQETDVLAKQRDVRQSLEACDVADAEAAVATREHAYETAEAAVTEAQTRLRTRDTRLQSLVCARLRQDAAEAKQAGASAAAALAALDEDATTQALRTQLAENSAALHYLFAQEEADCAALRTRLLGQEQHLKEAQADENKNAAALRQELRRLTRELGKTEAAIQSVIARMEAIESEIFDDRLQADAKAQRDVWQRDLAHVKTALADDEKNLTFYDEQKRTLQRKLPEDRDRLAHLQHDIAEMNVQLSAIDAAAGGLLERLRLIPACANMAQTTLELYQRSTFFKDQLGDTFIREDEKRRHLALRCRQAHRFVDQYADAASFTADPALEALLDAWQNDFPTLESGADAYRAAVRSGRDADELRRRFPFWAASVVTAEAAAPDLLRRLATKADELTAPVFVLTSGELRALLTEGDVPFRARSVTPSYWVHLLDDDFHAWLDGLRAEATRRDDELEQQSATCENLKQLRAALVAFYEKHAFSEYQELQTSRDEAQAKAERLVRTVRDSEATIEECQQSIGNYQKLRYDHKAQQDALEHRLTELDVYEQLQGEHRQHLKAQEALRRDEQATQARLDASAKQAAHLASELQNVLTSLGAQESRAAAIRQRLYYDDIQEAAPQKTDKRYSVLADERRRLLGRIDGIQANRGRLEEQLAQAERDQKRLAKELQRTQSEAAGNGLAIDETLAYPLDGAEQEQRLRSERPALLQETKTRTAACAKAQRAYDKATGTLETVRKRYVAQYGEPIRTVDGDLAEARAELEQQQRALASSLAACRTTNAENAAHVERLEGVLNRLDKENVTLQFTIDRVRAILLPEDWQTDDSAVLAAAAPPLLTESRAIYDRCAVQREKNRAAKQTFIAYCEQHIREERRRRHIVDGIRSKDAYEDYVEWRAVILQTIQQSIALAETEKQEHFSHIEHMVEHMTLYLQEIGRGLKEIAAKTRIRTEAGTKDIYTIHFTEKKDSEMRTAIRAYLGSLTERLDTDAFVGEDGREDSRKVKEELQKQLRTQQILAATLGGHAIKVKCRKATSAGTFSERPYDWEESNKWSGGEIWSKNMALFLGCLNYLSEKRSRRTRTHFASRVVVADNPFGKASSDHVLDPVFFIAEQLGFQILALTAHEDGSFVRKYFPVVYSCRFADIAGGKGKVLHPDMQIQTAFFEEHNPEALERLESFEETGLFGD